MRRKWATRRLIPKHWLSMARGISSSKSRDGLERTETMVLTPCERVERSLKLAVVNITGFITYVVSKVATLK